MWLSWSSHHSQHAGETSDSLDPVFLQLNSGNSASHLPIRWGRSGKGRNEDGTLKSGETCDFYCEAVYRSKYAQQFTSNAKVGLRGFFVACQCVSLQLQTKASLRSNFLLSRTGGFCLGLLAHTIAAKSLSTGGRLSIEVSGQESLLQRDEAFDGR